MSEADWLNKRQQQYDRLLAEMGGAPSDRASEEAWALHRDVMEELDALPISEGGKGKSK